MQPQSRESFYRGGGNPFPNPQIQQIQSTQNVHSFSQVDPSPSSHSNESYGQSTGLPRAGSSSRTKRPQPERDELDEFDEDSPEPELVKPKSKTTRGSRACTVCRRLKMRCVGAEIEGPCNRCKKQNSDVSRLASSLPCRPCG